MIKRKTIAQIFLSIAVSIFFSGCAIGVVTNSAVAPLVFMCIAASLGFSTLFIFGDEFG